MSERLDFSELAQGALVFTAALSLNSALSKTVEILSPIDKDVRGSKVNAVTAHWLIFAFTLIAVIILLYLFNKGVEIKNKINGSSEKSPAENKEMFIKIKDHGKYLKAETMRVRY